MTWELIDKLNLGYQFDFLYSAYPFAVHFLIHSTKPTWNLKELVLLLSLLFLCPKQDRYWHDDDDAELYMMILHNIIWVRKIEKILYWVQQRNAAASYWPQVKHNQNIVLLIFLPSTTFTRTSTSLTFTSQRQWNHWFPTSCSLFMFMIMILHVHELSQFKVCQLGVRSYRSST